MATYSGQVQSYVNTAPDKRMVSDRILMIEPYNIPTYLALGTDVSKFNMTNREGKVYEWLEDTFVPVSTTLNSAAMTTSTGTTVTLTPASLTLLQPGDVLLIGSEQMWVSAVTSGVGTVTRGWGGTTQATHATGATITLVGRARIDGDEADSSPYTEVATGYNYTQILQRTIEVARSKEKLAEYGVSSWEDYMIDKEMKSLMMFLNKLPFYGKRPTTGSGLIGGAGTAAAARTAGGLRTYITNNLTYATVTDATGGTAAALVKDDIDDTLVNIWDDGGKPDLIICGAHAQRKINSFYEGFIMQSPDYNIGGNLITKLRHPITGDILDILVDRHCPTNELWLLSREHIAFYPFDPFFYERLAKVGDSVKGEIVGEYGFIVRFDKAHGAVLEFSTSL
jgi:hypothetical protein